MGLGRSYALGSICERVIRVIFVGEWRTGSLVGLGGQRLTANIDCLFVDLNTYWLEGAV